MPGTRVVILWVYRVCEPILAQFQRDVIAAIGTTGDGVQDTAVARDVGVGEFVGVDVADSSGELCGEAEQAAAGWRGLAGRGRAAQVGEELLE